MADKPKTKKPNILVIWGDDIGISNLSCYSHGMMGAFEKGHVHRTLSDADGLTFDLRVPILGSNVYP